MEFRPEEHSGSSAYLENYVAMEASPQAAEELRGIAPEVMGREFRADPPVQPVRPDGGTYRGPPADDPPASSKDPA